MNLDKPFILASQSPRRQKLLRQLGFEFEVLPADIDEDDFSDGVDPVLHVKELSLKKAEFVAKKIGKPAVVLGSDTIVVLNGIILNKPVDKLEAVRMLNILSGKTHIVYTGIALVDSESMKNEVAVQKTEVTFRTLTQDEIEAYVETGSPLDKAGAYGIQDDFGAVFVSHINGCYYNIVGLPLELLYSTMKKFLGELKE
ncbi:MAG: septum formation protein Maf [Ignavibacteria bacterium GWB2_35_12]|nr:MAG: septum formation protein Maf [Ignavibacteria bacterium GWA2_35_8]OGU38065.1 MAG: septum formation protein Maf [Ignavibacteria bacterium GWB2_35_12]OGU95692.1 MAG: septum formation protein Maf [Ignavibacteria bacterium RIFOXYA2_FULL_35_10]OGV25102.1 MAG: septum formation protein Maf [Ignavibacteria bacterium RIFOXYC2_FULL_35_21]